jgi:ribosome-binding protein aMBF1 (putative translation factor)
MDEEIREKLRRWRPKLNQFSNRVRQARRAAGIKQASLAQAVGKPRLWLVKRECGWIRMNIPESEILLAAVAKMKRSQKADHENKVNEAVSPKQDNRAIA